MLDESPGDSRPPAYLGMMGLLHGLTLVRDFLTVANGGRPCRVDLRIACPVVVETLRRLFNEGIFASKEAGSAEVVRLLYHLEGELSCRLYVWALPDDFFQ